jgi:hypothetical protein
VTCSTGLTVCADGCADLSTDPHHCGTCDHDCLGGACVSSACLPSVIATNQQAPWSIAVLGNVVYCNVVYWTNDKNPGSVVSCPLSGCPGGPTVIASNQASPARLAVDSSNICFTNFDDGTVARCPLTGCGAAPTVLATGQTQPMGITFFGSSVYWVDSAGNGDNAVRTCPSAGCGSSPTTLTTVAGSGGLRTVVTDGTSLYFTTAGGSVYASPLSGGAARPLATNQNAPYFIALHGADLYWTNSGASGGVATCATSSCSPKSIASAPGAFGLAIDDSAIYWTTSSGYIMSCPLSGCGPGPRVLASGQASPFGIALDATAVYWTNTADGTVRKLAK